MNIELREERQKVLVEKVQVYFEKELDQSIGQLKAEMILEFFVKELGPEIYNQAIDDAHTFIQEKLIDLESTLYMPENGN